MKKKIKVTKGIVRSSHMFSLMQKQPPVVFHRKRCFYQFEKFTGKHLCRGNFFKKSYRPSLINFGNTTTQLLLQMLLSKIHWNCKTPPFFSRIQTLLDFAVFSEKLSTEHFQTLFYIKKTKRFYQKNFENDFQTLTVFAESSL